MEIAFINHDDNEASEETIELLSSIDPGTSIIISNGLSPNLIKYDPINQFSFKSTGANNIIVNNILTYNIYPAFKIMAPEGIIPYFECPISGLHIESSLFESSVIEGNNKYILYSDFQFIIKEYDRKLFSNNKFLSFNIPNGQDIVNIKLMLTPISKPITGIYVINGKYIYKRLPNF